MTYQHYLDHKHLEAVIHNYNNTYGNEAYASITLADGSKFNTPSETLSDSKALTDFMDRVSTQYPGLEFDVCPINYINSPKQISQILDLPIETVRERLRFMADLANISITELVHTTFTEPQFNYFKTGNKDLLWTSQPSE